jgi:hypothetical protein
VSLLPDNIQWAPPGLHKVRPSPLPRAQETSRYPIFWKLFVDASWVPILNADLDAWRKKAKEGLCDEPFADFGHKSTLLVCEGEPAFFVQSFLWGGTDPLHGGVRVEARWNPKMLNFIFGTLGGQFNCLSACPRFNNNELLRPTLLGTWPNIGGLVHASAFEKIQPIQIQIGKPEDIEPNQK